MKHKIYISDRNGQISGNNYVAEFQHFFTDKVL